MPADVETVKLVTTATEFGGIRVNLEHSLVTEQRGAPSAFQELHLTRKKQNTSARNALSELNPQLPELNTAKSAVSACMKIKQEVGNVRVAPSATTAMSPERFSPNPAVLVNT